MIRPIIKDVYFLQQNLELATKDDLVIIIDLLDTIDDNRDECVKKYNII